jgi:2-polyprenyl-6-methoxyphenol hydroxylase-like FAD-dependent oxidoreductase
MNIAVVGAGIAGLAVAKGLIDAGHAVRIYERAPELRAVGAGIGLWPTAVACLRQLGLAHALAPSVEIHAFEFRSAAGQGLARADLSAHPMHMGESLRFVDRGALLRALAASAPPQSLHLGRNVLHIRPQRDHLTLELADGSTDPADTVIVGCGVAAATLPGAPAARGRRFSGATCWRGVCPAHPLAPHEVCTIHFGNARRFGINPLPGNRLYWWATYRTAPDARSDDHKADLLRLFAAFSRDVHAAIGATPAAAIRRDDLVDADSPCWGDDRIVAIGDAAHPILPTLGMAGTAAVEDAWVLVDEYARGPGFAYRLHQRRTARVNRLRRLSRLACRVGHARGPAALLRNFAFASLPDHCIFRSALDLQRKDLTL